MITARENKTIVRTAKVLLALAVFVALQCAAVCLQGSAVATPPSHSRQWTFTAAGTPILSASTTTVVLSDPATGFGPSASLNLVNDNTAGGADLWFNLETAAISAAPVNGTAGDNVMSLKPGERLNLDGRFTRILLKASTGSTTEARVQATY